MYPFQIIVYFSSMFYISCILFHVIIGEYTVKILIIIITRDLYCTAKCRSKLRDAGLCTSAKRMTSILRHVAEAFPPAKQRTILNKHRVIGIATNTSMVLNCALVTYIMMTADVGCCSTSYPGPSLKSYPGPSLKS